MSILKNSSIWVVIFAVTLVFDLFSISGAVAQNEKLRLEESEKVQKKDEVKKEAELETMVVTATKTPINVREVPATVNVVTLEEIKLRAQTDNVYDAIRNVPGVNITYEGTRPVTYIRGARPSVLINGREMSQFAGFYHLYGGLIGMGAVDRIEVLKGPQSAIHGSKAVSGVINVILKKGDKDDPYVEAGGFAGHGDQLQGSLRVSGGHDKLSYFLNVGAENQPEPEWETSDGTIPFTEERKQNIYSRFDYEINKKHTLSLEYMYNEGTEISGGKGTFYQQLSTWRFIYDQDYKLQSAFLSYQGDFTDWFSLYAFFGLGENDYKWAMGPNGTMDPASYPGGDTLDKYLNKKNVGKALEDFTTGEIRGTFSLLPENRLRAIAGVQYKDTELDWTWRQYNNLVLDVQEDEMYIAPYLQVEYRPIHHALLTAGVRYDSYDSGNKDSQKTSPGVGLSLFPFAHTDRNWTTLWASYSEAFKAPQANQLIGYGLVVGLNGTGDKSGTTFTVQSLVNMVERMGVHVDEKDVSVKNVAAVMVTTKIPPFARIGNKIDVVVSSIGDAKSLLGGTLLLTPLRGVDRKVYALAQGPLCVGGFTAGGAAGGGVIKNHPTVARISRGATIEREIPVSLQDKHELIITLNNPDFTTAIRVRNAINESLGQALATTSDSGTLKLNIPEDFQNRVVQMIATIENLEVTPDSVARVVVNEKTGTVVIGENVRISTVAVAHGNLSIQIKERALVSQPSPFAPSPPDGTGAGQFQLVPFRVIDLGRLRELRPRGSLASPNL